MVVIDESSTIRVLVIVLIIRVFIKRLHRVLVNDEPRVKVNKKRNVRGELGESPVENDFGRTRRIVIPQVAR